MSQLTHHRLAFVLAFVVALAPFALDAYLPAFTSIAGDFGVSVSEVGLTLSLYVIAMAAGQLVGGPLSDRYGRPLIMFTGLVVFIAGSVMVVFSESLNAMLLGRVVQAFGGGWSSVGVPAIARERTEGNETARLFSLVAMIMFVAPALAPGIGSLLLEFGGWHSIFVFLAAYAVLAALLLKFAVFNEPQPRPAAADEPLHRLVTNYVQVLKNFAAMRFVAMQALAFSIMLVYLTHASFIYQQWLGFSNTGFSILFALNVAVMMAASTVNRRLLAKRDMVNLLAIALGVQALAVVALAAVVAFDLPRLLAIPALALAVGSMGAIAPNNMAGALRYFRALAGTAAALMGAIQFSFSGLVGTLSALVAADEMNAVVITMAASSALALVIVTVVKRSGERDVEQPLQ